MRVKDRKFNFNGVCPRLKAFAGALYRVSFRGDRKEDIYRDEENRWNRLEKQFYVYHLIPRNDLCYMHYSRINIPFDKAAVWVTKECYRNNFPIWLALSPDFGVATTVT